MKEKVYTEEVLNPTFNYLEKDLHPALTKWLYECHKCYTRTIDQSESSNTEKGENEWLHPDMVGVQFVDSKENNEYGDLETLKTNAQPVAKAIIYSFELKRGLTLGRLKEYYFQAVSNSTWANEGYLVISEIDESNQKLLKELKRLVDHFGIGVILLNLQSLEETRILFNASRRDKINFETLEKFYEINNTGLIEFIKNVNSYIKTEDQTARESLIKTGFNSVLNKIEWENYLNQLKSREAVNSQPSNEDISVIDSQNKLLMINKELQLISFDDDWTGKDFKKVAYNKKRIQEVETCKEVYHFIIQIILEEYGEKPIQQYCDSKKGKKIFTFSTDSLQQMHAPKTIKEFNLYYESNFGNKDLKRKILNLLRYTNISVDDIQIWIKTESK